MSVPRVCVSKDCVALRDAERALIATSYHQLKRAKRASSIRLHTNKLMIVGTN
jgi:hypothetical protein